MLSDFLTVIGYTLLGGLMLFNIWLMLVILPA